MLILLYKTWTPTASIRAVKAETDKKCADKQTTVTLLRMRRGLITLLEICIRRPT